MSDTKEIQGVRPDAGFPPDGDAETMDRLYGFKEKVRPIEERHTPVKAVEAKDVEDQTIPEKDRRLLARLHNATSQLTIRVNKVEFSLDVLDVSRTELSVCCLVQLNGMRIKLPRSESVEIELEGKIYKTAFLGSWHTIEWLGLHVVVFPVIPEEVES